MLVGVATAVLVASCAPSDDEIIVDRSGSRLKLTWMVTPDGSRLGVADGLYDARLGIKCAPSVSLTEVDVQPCLPPGTGVVSTFADAGCTRPVTGRSEQPYFVTQRDCRIRVFKAAGTATVAATYGLGADGACAPLTLSTKPESQEWYEGVEVPLSTFAELRLVREPGAGRLRRLGIRSMDGMATSLRGMAYDSALETVCGVDRFSCDPLATLPTGYASGTCSQRIAFADKLAPSCSHFPVVAAKSGACTAEQYFPVTGPAGAGIPLEDSSTGCWRNPRTS